MTYLLSSNPRKYPAIGCSAMLLQSSIAWRPLKTYRCSSVVFQGHAKWSNSHHLIGQLEKGIKKKLKRLKLCYFRHFPTTSYGRHGALGLLQKSHKPRGDACFYAHTMPAYFGQRPVQHHTMPRL